MFRDLLPDEPLTLVAVRERVKRLPRGSLQRMAARLWLAWLAHSRYVQLYGHIQFTDQCKPFETITEFLEAFPWECCEKHQLLSNARHELFVHAKQLTCQPSPHQAPDVLTPQWWQWYHGSYRYHPRRRVIERPYGGMGDD